VSPWQPNLQNPSPLAALGLPCHVLQSSLHGTPTRLQLVVLTSLYVVS